MHQSSREGVEKQIPTSTKTRLKPRLRGVLHRYAFVASLLPCLLLISEAPSGRATLASIVYAGSLVGLLGTSALYHGINWSPRSRFWRDYAAALTRISRHSVGVPGWWPEACPTPWAVSGAMSSIPTSPGAP